MEGFGVGFMHFVSFLGLELEFGELGFEGVVLVVDGVCSGLFFPEFEDGFLQNVDVGLEFFNFLVLGFYLLLCPLEGLFTVLDFGAVQFALGKPILVPAELSLGQLLPHRRQLVLQRLQVLVINFLTLLQFLLHFAVLQVENLGFLVEFEPGRFQFLSQFLVFLLQHDDGFIQLVDSQQFIFQLLRQLDH